ncbi:hypothetical protein [Luteimonas sp. gir]|uniref:hypothetical protein n=1 Tax=Luteimonas sp. gir TaxID=3127960 RepID=UPI003075B44A
MEFKHLSRARVFSIRENGYCNTIAHSHCRGLILGRRIRVDSLSRRFCHAVVLSLGLVPIAGLAQQGAVTPYQEYSKLVNSAEMVAPLGGDIFGDSTSLYNGESEFSAVDIDIPGNSALPVRLGRRLKIESREWMESVGGFGIWDLDIPHMSGVFDVNFKWNVAANGSTARCSQAWYPRTDPAAEILEVWSGNHLYIPGVGQQEVLWLSDVHPVPQGASRTWGTREGYRFACLPSMKNGYAGEAFVAISPEGVRYTFDIGLERLAPIMDGGRAYYVMRVKVLLLPSRIEDVHGNWVAFDYASGKLSSITASDGRKIDLFYDGKEIVRATANGRSWQYHYLKPEPGQGFNNLREALLTSVVLPDGSSWRMSYLGSLESPKLAGTANVNPNCPAPLLRSNNDVGLDLVHPSGATGSFRFRYLRHLRSGVPDTCYALVPNWQEIPIQVGGGRTHALAVPNYFDNLSLLSKRIEGPGLSSMTWQYDYGSVTGGRLPWNAVLPCSNCQSFKTVSVTRPDGHVEESLFGVLYQSNDGRLLGTRVRDGAGSVYQAQEIDYVTDAEQQSMPFPSVYGETSILGADPSSLKNRPVRERRTTQGGVTFSWRANAFDHFARPLSVTKSSGPIASSSMQQAGSTPAAQPPGQTIDEN